MKTIVPTLSIVLAMVLIITGCTNKNINKYGIENDKKSITDNMQDLKLTKEILDYTTATEAFELLGSDEVRDKIQSGDSFFLYTGRVTCQWCRVLVPVLSDITQQSDSEVVYLDSELTDSDTKLKQFRKEYNIEFVPSLIYFDGNGPYQTIDMEVTSETFGENSLKEVLEPYLCKDR